MMLHWHKYLPAMHLVRSSHYSNGPLYHVLWNMIAIPTLPAESPTYESLRPLSYRYGDAPQFALTTSSILHNNDINAMKLRKPKIGRVTRVRNTTFIVPKALCKARGYF